MPFKNRKEEAKLYLFISHVFVSILASLFIKRSAISSNYWIKHVGHTGCVLWAFSEASRSIVLSTGHSVHYFDLY